MQRREPTKSDVIQLSRTDKFGVASLKIAESLSYSIAIQLVDAGPWTLEHIQRVSICRSWSDGSTSAIGQRWFHGGVLSTLAAEHFEPCSFRMGRPHGGGGEDVGRSVSLLALLALRTKYDSLRGSQYPGLLTRSEIVGLRKSGVWQGPPDIERIKSDVACSARPARSRYKVMPLAKWLLLNGHEIHNLICGMAPRWTPISEREKLWALNVPAGEIKFTDDKGVEIKEGLMSKLSSVFSACSPLVVKTGSTEEYLVQSVTMPRSKPRK